jgi:antitoxin component YwqK of YwqJK toxin-antitoxin module
MSSDKLQFKQDIAYEVGSENPFTGQVFDYFDKEEKSIKSEANYKNGYKDGKCVDYFENGKIKSENNFVIGKFNGKQTEFFKNGQAKEEKEYFNGNCLKISRWNENGALVEKLRFINNKLISWDGWYDNGNKKGEFQNDTSIAIGKINYYTDDHSESFNAYYINSYELPLLQMLGLVGKPSANLKSSSFLGTPELEKSSITDKCGYPFFVLDENQNLVNSLNIIFNYHQRNASFIVLAVTVENVPIGQSNQILSILNRFLNEQGFREEKPNRLVSKQKNMRVDIYKGEKLTTYLFWDFIQ